MDDLTLLGCVESLILKSSDESLKVSQSWILLGSGLLLKQLNVPYSAVMMSRRKKRRSKKAIAGGKSIGGTSGKLMDPILSSDPNSSSGYSTFLH